MVGLTTVQTLWREHRRQRQEVFVPLVHRPGEEAQVDFFEVTVEVDGERRRVWKLLIRLMHSGRDFAWLYHRGDQVAFLDGHVRAFAHFGMRKLPTTAAEGLLELILRRYERASTLLTSNRPIADWGRLLRVTTAVTAMLDRLLHCGHLLQCGPRSWRTRQAAALRRQPKAG